MSKYVRLRINKKGGSPARFSFRGNLYQATLPGQAAGSAGVWYIVDDETAALMTPARQAQYDDDSQAAFDIMDEAGARETERKELAVANEKRLAGEAPLAVHRLKAAISVNGAKFDAPAANDKPAEPKPPKPDKGAPPKPQRPPHDTGAPPKPETPK